MTGSQLNLILLQTGLGNYTPEFLSAYQYAYKIGITTAPDIIKAQLEWGLIRKDLAKMIVNFAVKALGKKPDTTVDCTFPDMSQETPERQAYARLACQLGIMGRDTKGNVATTFAPNAPVTRAQFATTLSRVLRWHTYDWGMIYYLNHLKALQRIHIVKTTDNASSLEKRWYVMVMLMRTSELKE